jgi:plasmid maintenance system antidote protein VapI
MTMREVASAIGVPLITYSEWEYGRAIRGDNLFKLAKFYGTSTDLLLNQNRTADLSSEQRLDRTLDDLQIVRAELMKSQKK